MGGSSELFRSNESNWEQLGIGGDFTTTRARQIHDSIWHVFHNHGPQ